MKRNHHYEVTVEWTGNQGTGTSGQLAYSRDHDVLASLRPVLEGSSDPAFRGSPERWNPELLLVASLSECHLLFYLSLCAKAGVVVCSYVDAATGTMTESGQAGHFTEVILRPVVTVSEPAMIERGRTIHEQAHKFCYIANSVNFPVRHEAVVGA